MFWHLLRQLHTISNHCAKYETPKPDEMKEEFALDASLRHILRTFDVNLCIQGRIGDLKTLL